MDPYLGFLHEIDYGRESLAADLIEPLRPRINRWVWGLFRDRVLRPDHFTRERGGCLLGKEGRKCFYMHHEAVCPGCTGAGSGGSSTGWCIT